MDATRKTAPKPGLEQTPRQVIERWEEELGLSAGELAGALGTSTRTLERWRVGEVHPQRQARGRLAALLELADHLQETFIDTEAARRWLRTPSGYLGGLRPAEAMGVGRADRVEAALEALDSGVFIGYR